MTRLFTVLAEHDAPPKVAATRSREIARRFRWSDFATAFHQTRSVSLALHATCLESPTLATRTRRKQWCHMPKREDKHAATIADTPAFKEAATHVDLAKLIATWGPRVRPILRLFGVDLSRFDSSIADISALLPNMEGLIDLPDRFNKLYASRGWIATSIMSAELMVQAVELGERGDLSAGEGLLVSQFNAETLEWHLLRLGTLEHFFDRRELARLTMLDFLEERYHACVPNLLMLIDGLASDASGSNESFFSERADLNAWDLVEGHPSGLPALSRLMQVSRMKRRTEPLTIPFRHGILHGRDLGFANKLVAAKCWAALIAVGEWARAVQNGRRAQPSPSPAHGLLDSLRRLAETTRRGERLRTWRPRGLVPGENASSRGPASAYEPGTPEHALASYLDYWLRRNFGDMAKLVTIGSNKVDHRTRARDINRAYRPLRLASYELTAVEERGPMATNFTVNCTFLDGDDVSFDFLVVFENESGDFIHDDLDKGTWRILNWHVVTSHVQPHGDHGEEHSDGTGNGE
jgi:hypothetical protein